MYQLYPVSDLKHKQQSGLINMARRGNYRKSTRFKREGWREIQRARTHAGDVAATGNIG